MRHSRALRLTSAYRYDALVPTGPVAHPGSRLSALSSPVSVPVRRSLCSSRASTLSAPTSVSATDMVALMAHLSPTSPMPINAESVLAVIEACTSGKVSAMSLVQRLLSADLEATRDVWAHDGMVNAIFSNLTQCGTPSTVHHRVALVVDRVREAGVEWSIDTEILATVVNAVDFVSMSVHPNLLDELWDAACRSPGDGPASLRADGELVTSWVQARNLGTQPVGLDRAAR